jgi:NADPH:quinone reductase-like Zn-dependent oxidoreductase
MKRATGKNIGILAVPQNRNDLVAITELCEAGKVTPVIDRRYPLQEVPDALRYVGEGRHKGKVVITLENNSKI